ncbi:metallo-beta-lactamase class B [Sphingobium xenophagum]|uniref:Metallo-beta-lactamase class B n=2 Tax=Sphingobium xenophagum TaxID=121428 RepID=A0ABU1X4T1_SPHXE|nr:metallo-beta-lactamase class B [Sphingobium xenophagum]
MIATMAIAIMAAGGGHALQPKMITAQAHGGVTKMRDPAPGATDPLTRPMAVEQAKEWLVPLPPEKIFGNSYLVGFGGLSVALIDTGAGLILIDGALPQAAPAILNNVRKLGFDPKDIKFILSTEPHFDHSGGLAALARDTGATVIASARGAEGLRSGVHAKDDPQLGYGGRWPRVTHVCVVKDREVLRLGRTAITAHATPGHTMGSMSWSWRACDKKACKTMLFASSLNPVSADGYRYTAASNAAILNGFAASYARMNKLPCDILISAHPDNAGEGRYDDKPGGCRRYADRSRQLLAKRLGRERGEAVK